MKAKQVELGVPEYSADRPGPWVVCDARYNPVEVYDICAQFRWYGMMGTDSEEFVHGDPRMETAGKRALFSEGKMIDIGFGTKEQGRLHAIYFLWASQKVQDILARLRDGNAQQWEIPSDIMSFCPDYASHINSHVQILEQDRKGAERRVWKRIGGHPDHLYDCESMVVVIGLMAGVFKRE